jgi:hypothetical protein
MPQLFAALVNLNHPGRYVHWGFIQISVANLLVIGLMLVVFVLALVLPFPHGKRAAHTGVTTPNTAAVTEQAEVEATER